jgi:hypothetical protein
MPYVKFMHDWVSLASYRLQKYSRSKSPISLNITTRCPVKVKWRFGGTYSFYLQGRRVRQVKNQRQWLTPSISKSVRRFGGTHVLLIQDRHVNKTRLCLLTTSCWFLAWITLRPKRWRRYVPPKLRLPSTDPHGVISHKIGLFITIALRASNPVCTRVFMRI